jgi:hypothetical protein
MVASSFWISIHVDVMGASSLLWVTLDEPGVERWAVVPVRWAPKVLVALRFQHRCDAHLRRLQIGHFYEHVHDGLRREPMHSRTAEVQRRQTTLAPTYSLYSVRTNEGLGFCHGLSHYPSAPRFWH